MRVLCLGDSLTEGTVGVGFIPFLREFLSGHEYVNLGVNGDTIAGLRRRAERLAPHLRGDVAVVWIGTNDVLTYPDWVENSPVAEEDYRLMLRAVAARVRVVFAVPPLVAGPGLAEMYEYSLGRATEMVRRLSEEAGCRYLDIQSSFAGRPGREFTVDGTHLNDAGARLVAEVLSEYLRTVLV
ncbi:MAG: GDSL-type esterase/lipase family protein [candidate division WOR-3 bacterium]|nr:GDSL-type esterase/lipase family protein [candidate division WOR-3 bacterium]